MHSIASPNFRLLKTFLVKIVWKQNQQFNIVSLETALPHWVHCLVPICFPAHASCGDPYPKKKKKLSTKNLGTIHFMGFQTSLRTLRVIKISLRLWNLLLAFSFVRHTAMETGIVFKAWSHTLWFEWETETIFCRQIDGGWGRFHRNKSLDARH